MIPPVDLTIKGQLNELLKNLETEFNSDIFTYYGPLIDNAQHHILELIETVAKEKKSNSLTVILTTSGGSAIAVERYVNIIRHNYSEVNFIIPDFAYSAGTIFCMSGDNIFMDYSSVLGPIDPQVQTKDGRWVAALGYLDKVNQLLDKAKNNELTQAEFIILKDLDLAELRGYEQAKDLTIALLEKWLVKYKFKNWELHQTNELLKGQKVSHEEKVIRAKEIASQLSDNSRWHSHGRPINIETLENELKLKIIDYSNDDSKRKLIRDYYLLLSDYVIKNNNQIFVHTRRYI